MRTQDHAQQKQRGESPKAPARREQFKSSEAQMRSCVFDGRLSDSTSLAPAVAGSPQGPEVGPCFTSRRIRMTTLS